MRRRPRRRRRRSGSRRAIPMRVLACPASLKGVLSPVEAADALAEGLRRGERIEGEQGPAEGGGGGTLEVISRARGGEWRTALVSDPLGRPVEARWLLLPDGRSVVESAQAIGLTLLAPEERDPLRASSRGLGELVLAALSDGPPELLVSLGGSATLGGGAGVREGASGVPGRRGPPRHLRGPPLRPPGRG